MPLTRRRATPRRTIRGPCCWRGWPTPAGLDRRGHRVLVTSRPYGLSEAEAARLGLPSRPLPLDEPCSELLVRRWFDVLAARAGTRPDAGRGHAGPRRRAARAAAAGRQPDAADRDVHHLQRRQTAAAGQVRTVRPDPRQRAVQPLPQRPDAGRPGPRPVERGGLWHAHRRGLDEERRRRRPRPRCGVDRCSSAIANQSRRPRRGSWTWCRPARICCPQRAAAAPRRPTGPGSITCRCRSSWRPSGCWSVEGDQLVEFYRASCSRAGMAEHVVVRVRLLVTHHVAAGGIRLLRTG